MKKIIILILMFTLVGCQPSTTLFGVNAARINYYVEGDDIEEPFEYMKTYYQGSNYYLVEKLGLKVIDVDKKNETMTIKFEENVIHNGEEITKLELSLNESEVIYYNEIKIEMEMFDIDVANDVSSNEYVLSSYSISNYTDLEESDLKYLNVSIITNENEDRETIEAFCKIELEDYEYGQCTFFLGFDSYLKGFKSDIRFGFFEKVGDDLYELMVE